MKQDSKMASTTAVPPSTFAACHAVLNTVELLENILLCLEPVNVFGVRRVSRMFLDTITSSTPIQQAIFLKAVPEPDKWVCRATANFPAEPCEFRYSGYELVRASEGDRERPHYVNKSAGAYCSGPLITTKLCPLLDFEDNLGKESRFMDSLSKGFCVLQIQHFMERKGSWSEMLVTNYPRNLVQTTTTIELTEPRSTITADSLIANPQGVTIGDIVTGATTVPPTDVCIARRVGGRVDKKQIETKSVDDILRDMQLDSGQQVEVLSRRIKIALKKMALPSDEEVQEMKEKGRLACFEVCGRFYGPSLARTIDREMDCRANTERA